MRWIQKTNAGPRLFVDWLEVNTEEIEAKIADRDTTGDDLWDFFRDNADEYDALKTKLIEEQGYICCYCGKRIQNDNSTSIEHVKPKSIYKQETLKFSNLLVSCNGSHKNQIHVIQLSETLLFVAEKYGVDQEYLEDVYVNVDNVKLFGKEYDLENLQIGDRIVVIPFIKGEQHCDNKKGKKEIDISPLQKDCESKFSYDRLSGKIVKTIENKLTLEVLGLNSNRLLNQLRKKKLDSADFLVEQLMEDFGDNPIELIDNRALLLNNLERPNPITHYLEPFVFVLRWGILN